MLVQNPVVLAGIIFVLDGLWCMMIEEEFSFDIEEGKPRASPPPRIADAICSLEFRVWLKEFGEKLGFKKADRRYAGDHVCFLDLRAE